LNVTLKFSNARPLGSPRSELCEEAVRNRLNKQRDHLFTFLDHPGVDATNNLADASCAQR
jgi:hypothetical protein